MSKKIRTSVLARYLDVSPATVRSWVTSGFMLGASGFTTARAIDEFLAGVAHNFGGTPPTWGDVCSGTVVFCDYRIAAQELDITPQQFKDATTAGRLPIARLAFPTGHYRYSLQSVRALRNSVRPSVDGRIAAHYMGYRVLDNMIKIPDIEVTQPIIGRRGGSVSITIDSLRRYLREHLRLWIRVYDWIEACDSATEPLLTMGEVQALMPYPEGAIHKMLREEQGLYISRPNGRGRTVMVLPQWLYERLGWDRPIALQRVVGAIFGVGHTTVSMWHIHKLISCSVPTHIHEESDAYLWPLCWLAFLRANASPPLRPLLPALLNRALAGQSELISIRQLATHLRMRHERVGDWARSGQLPVVRTPGGHYRTSLAWARKAGFDV